MDLHTTFDMLSNPVQRGRRWVFADGTTVPVISGGDGPIDLTAVLADVERVAELEDDELIALEASLEAAAEERASDPTDEQLAEIEQIATAVESVRLEAQGRIVAAEQRSERAADALARIRASDDGGEGETETTETTETETTETAPDGTETETTETTETETTETEAIAAGGAPARPAPRIGRVAARRPTTGLTAPRRAGALPDDIADWGLVASANAPNTPAGSPIRTREQLARAFTSAISASAGYRHGPRTKINVVRAGAENPADLYGEERTLDGNTLGNIRKIDRAASVPAITAAGGFAALTAAGGICAPTPVRYDLPILGSEERPVRDTALVRFGADRGGVRVIPPPVIEDLDGAVDIWTEANDVNPTSPTVKPCLVLTCPDDEETFVQAITRCLEVGNFRSRYFPEQVEAWMRLATVNHARVAEIELLTSIGAASTQVTSGQVLGTTSDVLSALDRGSAIIRQANRLPANFPFRFVFPFWLYEMITSDIARQLPGATPDERFAIADAQINRWFAARDITPTAVLDGETGQMFNRQGDGPMQGWPSTVVTYLYPEGSHLFLDGGTLDLGIVRDSVLNSTNDAQMFAETFEGHVFHGVESWRLTMDLCPDGSTSSTVDISPCSTGS